jgi:hypothetical protein
MTWGAFPKVTTFGKMRGFRCISPKGNIGNDIKIEL